MPPRRHSRVAPSARPCRKAERSHVERLRWTDAATTPAPEGVPLLVHLVDGVEVTAKREGDSYRDGSGEREIPAAQVVAWRVLEPLATLPAAPE